MINNISIVIPAYNEEANIERTLLEVYNYLQKQKLGFEILVMNDGSTDQTSQRVGELLRGRREIKLIDNPTNRGKGAVIKESMKLVQNDYFLFMDADNSTPITEIKKFIPFLEQGVPAVIGSRYLNTSRIIYPQPRTRQILGRGYRLLSRLLFGLSLSDFNCGFKAYRTDIAKSIFQQMRMNDWTFDIELLYLFTQSQIQIQEVPIDWSHVEKKSHQMIFGTALRSLINLFYLRISLFNHASTESGAR